MIKFLTTTGLMLVLSAGSALANGFGINVTRVIFQGNSNSSTVVLRNSSSKDTYIVQSRVSKTVDGFEPTPFSITPPIFRLDPESTNNLRIRLNGNATLPHDRETIFYLNTRAIPASLQKELKDGSNRISGTAQFGIGTIIKIFYRPKNLPKTAEEAQKDVFFTIVSNGLSVKNNSAFYVSFAGLSIDGESLLKQGTPVMIAPYSDFIYATDKKSGKISWKTINDYGGINAYTTDL